MKALMIVRGKHPNLLNSCKSILKENITLIIGDCGCQENLPNLENIYYVQVPWEDSYAKARNYLMSHIDDFIIWFDPWEELTLYEEIEPDENLIYSPFQINNGIVSRPTRMWHTKNKINYINPVFEQIYEQSNSTLPMYITGFGTYDDSDILLSKWLKNEPNNSQVYYYLAMNCLSKGDGIGFKSHANKFIFAGKDPDAIVMLRYYLAILDIKADNLSSALSHIAYCLSEKPCMAEFWCLAASCFWSKKQYARATAIYQNAIDFGSKRKAMDGLPIEISKYKDEPESFINAIKNVVYS